MSMLALGIWILIGIIIVPIVLAGIASLLERIRYAKDKPGL